jgi:hypothetical protein
VKIKQLIAAVGLAVTFATPAATAFVVGDFGRIMADPPPSTPSGPSGEAATGDIFVGGLTAGLVRPGPVTTPPPAEMLMPRGGTEIAAALLSGTPDGPNLEPCPVGTRCAVRRASKPELS